MFPCTDASRFKLSTYMQCFHIPYCYKSVVPIRIMSNDLSQLQKKYHQMHHMSIVNSIIFLIFLYKVINSKKILKMHIFWILFQMMTKNLMCQALMIWFPRMKQIRITRNIWRGKNYRLEVFRDLISPIRNNWLNLLGNFF